MLSSFLRYLRETPEDETTVWHVTPTKNLPSIMQTGLVPQIGKRSQSAGEDRPAVFVFPDEESLEGAGEWLNDAMPRHAALLKVRVPKNWISHSSVDWEQMVTKPIPPDRIEVMSKDYLGEGKLPDSDKLITAMKSLTDPVKAENVTTTYDSMYVFPNGEFRKARGTTHAKTVLMAVAKAAGKSFVDPKRYVGVNDDDDDEDPDFDQVRPEIAMYHSGIARVAVDRGARMLGLETGPNLTDAQVREVRDAAMFGHLESLMVDLIDPTDGSMAASDMFMMDDDRLSGRVRSWMRKHV